MKMKKEANKYIFCSLLLGAAVLLSGAEKNIKVALAGSSACQSFNSKDPKLIWGWGEVIGQYFSKEVKILNFAISGRSTKSFILMKNWDKLLKSKPDYILMTLGANDTKGKKYSTTLEEYRKNLLRFAADAEKINAKIIFVTLNQSLYTNKKKNIAYFPPHGPLRKDRVPYSKVMREVAAQLKKPCLELFDRQYEIMKAMGEKECVKLYRYDKKGKIDGSHTNKAGAELLAKIIVDELRKSSSPLKKYTLDPKLKVPASPAKK